MQRKTSKHINSSWLHITKLNYFTAWTSYAMVHGTSCCLNLGLSQYTQHDSWCCSNTHYLLTNRIYNSVSLSLHLCQRVWTITTYHVEAPGSQAPRCFTLSWSECILSAFKLTGDQSTTLWLALHPTFKYHLDFIYKQAILNKPSHIFSVCFRIISRLRSCISITFISTPQCDEPRQ